MNKLTARGALKLLTLVSACLQVFLCSAAVFAQQPTPHGLQPPLPNTPDTEGDYRKLDPSRMKSTDRTTPTGRPTLGEIRRDFLQIQILNNKLQDAVTSSRLDYKYISATASKIKTLAGRLDANFALGKSEGERPRLDDEPSEGVLKSALSSLHDLVVSFVENPIFMERGVFDVQETKRAKRDVDRIIAVSDQVKKITRRLSKTGRKQP